VKLADYYKFLRDGNSQVRSDIFDANVRDYQGTTEVNREILKTLEQDINDDFWWFNNGITILSSKAVSSGSIITIENPQVVNGLQTSTQIEAYCEKNYEIEDNRTVMVKVVALADEEIRDKIIKATNNQNPVPPASLRATDKIQRDIEHHLKNNSLFYDRRKNFYKNDGKPASKIISISLLAQAVMTIFRGEPNNARARPSSLIKDNSVYNSLFSEKFPLDSYLYAAQSVRNIDVFLKEKSGLNARDRNNIRFYVLYWAVAVKAKSLNLNADRVSKITSQISDQEIETAITVVNNLFQSAGGSDQVAKGQSFRETIKESAKSSF
jgi:hypothetical protein